MANSTWSWRRIGLCFFHISLLTLCFLRVNANQDSPRSLVNAWARELENRLYSLTIDTTAYKAVKKAFEDGFEVQNLNTSIGVEFSNSIHRLLKPKMAAILQVKNKAEELEEKHKEIPNLKDFKYRNIAEVRKNFEKDNTTLMLKKTFSTTVYINTSYSFVQVPTNIYKEDSEVLNIAKWTQGLDSTFRSNYEKDNNLLWQYFGSAEGVFRTYPGKKWRVDKGARDKYDCRSSEWFIQASASAKDMVIVIDRSGTMIGNNIGIAKTAAMSIIDTLQENDFFNVISFNDKVSYLLKSCSKSLIQATKGNKEIMRKEIQKIEKPKKTGDVDKAIEEAFKMLITARDSNQTSAKCNKVIVFFSDGVEGDYAAKTQFDKYNGKVQARVFSFLVGRKKDPPVAAMQKMSCNNRGYFYKIETIGNVWDKVLEYTKVLSRPLSLTDEEMQIVYTPLYLDASGLGMMMSAAIPVFRKKKRLLGVAGTDIAVATLKDQVPHHKVGVYGYGFATNNNGFLLFHPNLKNQKGYLPSPPNVYLEDVEHSIFNQSVELKIKMINKETGTTTFTVYTVSPDGYIDDKEKKEMKTQRVVKTKMHYFYAPVAEFSVCVAVPEQNLQYLTCKGELSASNRKKGLEALVSSNTTLAMVSPWPYCNIPAAAQQMQELSKKAYPTAMEIRKHLMNVSDFTDCDKNITTDLLLAAAKIMEATQSSWDMKNMKKMKKNGIDSVFAGTNSGYSRSFYDGENPPIKRDVLKEDFYIHATEFAQAEEHTIVFSIPVRPEDTTIFKGGKRVNLSSLAVTVSTVVLSLKNTVGAVLGMKINSTKLNDMLLAVTSEINSTDGVRQRVNCWDTEKYGCYLVDETAYVVASNGGNNEVGKFFGLIQGRLMRRIISNTTINATDDLVYLSKSFHDVQADCVIPSSASSSASRILSPFFSIAGYVKWWSHTLAALLAQYSIYSWLSENNQVYASSKKKESCTKAMDRYRIYENMSMAINGSLPCTDSCTQSYTITKVNKTNLILIVVDNKCDGKCALPSLKQVASKVNFPDSECPKPSRYRRLTPNCFKYHEKESGQCGSAGNIRPTFFLLLTVILFTILILRK